MKFCFLYYSKEELHKFGSEGLVFAFVHKHLEVPLKSATQKHAYR